MPINSPLRFNSAPPELPRLMEASVWIKFSRPSRFNPLRPNAETMPEVAVCPKAKWVTDRYGKITDAQFIGVGNSGFALICSGFEFVTGDIALVIATNQFCIKLAPIIELNTDFLCLINHMVVGQHIALLALMMTRNLNLRRVVQVDPVNHHQKLLNSSGIFCP